MKEFSSLTVSDVLGTDGRLRSEIILTTNHTKGGKKRLVYLENKETRRALVEYIRERGMLSPQSRLPLFPSGKGGVASRSHSG